VTSTRRRSSFHYGDLGDATGLIRLIGDVQPDEIYNLGAMSHVKVSFDIRNTPPTPTDWHARASRPSVS
jgi:GDP-D-mannose dehydratase